MTFPAAQYSLDVPWSWPEFTEFSRRVVADMLFPGGLMRYVKTPDGLISPIRWDLFEMIQFREAIRQGRSILWK